MHGIKQDRIKMDLYKDEVPLVSENFRVLCANATNNPGLSFKGTIFHRIITDFVSQGGDFRNGTGTGGGSIYGDELPDVEVSRRRNRAFDLVTAHAVPKVPRNHTGPYPYTCGSQFFICVQPAPCLDAQHVVFGTVVAGKNTVLEMNSVGSRGGTPTKEVKIVDCGQVL